MSEHEDVGSVSEEAAKLLVALQDWAKEHVSDYTRGPTGFGSAYISDGSAACRVCPVCQLIAVLRGINPESIEQLSHATGSLLHALAGLVESTQQSQPRRGAPVQKIDLGEDPEEPTWP